MILKLHEDKYSNIFFNILLVLYFIILILITAIFWNEYLHRKQQEHLVPRYELYTAVQRQFEVSNTTTIFAWAQGPM